MRNARNERQGDGGWIGQINRGGGDLGPKEKLLYIVREE